MNYAELVSRLRNYSNRGATFLNDELIGQCIQTGQYRVWRELKDIGFEFVKIQNSNFIPNVRTIIKPADWDSTISFCYSKIIGADVFQKTQFLQPRNFEFCLNFWNKDADIANQPLFYCDHQYLINADSSLARTPYQGIYVSPTPALAYPYQLVYRQRLGLQANDDTNILYTKFEDLLFYSCLLEVLALSDNDPRFATFKELYDRCLVDANKQNEKRIFDRTTKYDNEIV